MRHPFRNGVLCASIIACATAFNVPALAQMKTTAQMEVESESLLRRGKRLETAISLMSEAVRREPKNARYTLLLACAQAERAHVLSGAVFRLDESTRRITAQKKVLENWDAAQSDPENPLYQKPRPQFPPEAAVVVPRTADDDKPLRVTEDAARQRIRDLSESSLDLLVKSARLSEETAPEVQAENAYLSGWTALILWNLPRTVVPESWPKKEGRLEPEGPERIIHLMEQAVKLQPENQSYRLGLADACQIAAQDRNSPFLAPARFDKALHERGRIHLLEAAKRRPNDGALWYRIACFDGQGESISAGLNARTPESVGALQQASKSLASNALVWYSLAAAQASHQDHTAMMISLDQGNSAPVLLPIRYKYSAPALVAWAFSEMSCRYPMLDNLITSGLIRLSREAREQKDRETVARTIRIALQMSKKYEAAARNTELIGLEGMFFASSGSMARTFAEFTERLP